MNIKGAREQYEQEQIEKEVAFERRRGTQSTD